MAKPKFRPDMMKARSTRTLALLGELSAEKNDVPVGVKKILEETEVLKEETLKILNKKIKTIDPEIIPVFS